MIFVSGFLKMFILLVYVGFGHVSLLCNLFYNFVLISNIALTHHVL